EDQIRKCSIYSPQDGQVVYVVSPQSKWNRGAQQGIIAQGEPVREGQKLMHIPNFTRMQVWIPVHEAAVAQVAVGQHALIRLNAYPARVFPGQVKKVAGVGAVLGHATADVKVYQTLVAIDGYFDGFRPNMSARVTIQANSGAKPVLTLPVQAIVRSPGRGER